MSLDWDASKVAPAIRITRDAEGQEQLSPITHALIFTTISVGLGSITTKNAAEFYARASLFHRLYGGLKFTPQDIVNHIGLRTNVSNETRAKWRERLIDNYVREEIYRFNHQPTAPAPALEVSGEASTEFDPAK